MHITEVRVKLMADAQDRLLAFCSLTFDNAFVVRDLKIIRGLKGPFVAMPSRKLTDRCHACGNKNALRSNFCSQCGLRLRNDRAPRGQDGRAKLYADIAHPINSECRELIQVEVIHAFERELVMAQQPGYVCRYDDYDDGMMDEFHEWANDELRPHHGADAPPAHSAASGSAMPASHATSPTTSGAAPAAGSVRPADDVQRRIDAPREPSTHGPHETRQGRSVAPAEEDFGEGVL